MKMVIVDCTLLKTEILKIVSELKMLILKRVFSEVNEIIQNIMKKLKNSMNGISTRSESVEKLIDSENKIEKFIKNDYFLYIKDYNKILDWLSHFYNKG